MRFDVLTLFAELFAPHLEHGVTRRAFASRQVDVRLWPLRDFGTGVHQRVDDRSFGGGPGMVMQAPVLARALAAVRADRGGADEGQAGARAHAPLVLFTPVGQPITQSVVQDLATSRGAILLCGRYEGIDQRFIDREVDIALSLGDFVMSGGELAALALLDAIARLQDGVLNDPESHRQDSFGPDGLLDCPHYTQPAEWDGQAVPAVLLSGHHAQIERWRREQSLLLTARLRPDLLAKARAEGKLSAADETFLSNRP